MSKRNTDDLLEYAWTIICNAGGGDWERETEEWQAAAARFRDQYHAWLPGAIEAERHREIGRLVETLEAFHTIVLSGSTVVLGGEDLSTIHRAPTLLEALRKAAGEEQ